MERTAFSAMGTDVELLLDIPRGRRSEEAFATAREEFALLEAILSRFRPESELSELNRAGRLDRASPDLVRVTELAVDGRARTGGRFDPTVHEALVAAGYDRTFDELGVGGTVTATRPPTPCLGAVSVARERGEIRLGPGVKLDFGGIGKGYAVDRACELLTPYWTVPRERGG